MHPTPDVLIKNGRVIDGTGNPWRRSDLALHGDRIVALSPPGTIDPDQCAEIVDASDRVVAPGFIDIQSHSILPLMRDGRALSKITQGVTSEIMGEAWTPAPVRGENRDPLANTLFVLPIDEKWRDRIRSWSRFSDWLESMEKVGVSPNVGSFLGGGTIRAVACGMRMGSPTADEMRTMEHVMAEAMEQGAFGPSYALIYPPDSYTSTEEIVQVCRVASRYGGIYITHMRSEADRLLEALEETLTIGREAEIPVEIYHLKAASPDNWFKMPSTIDRIERARADGQDVTADMYPYPASGTGLTAILPTWTAAEGRLFENLADPEIRKQIRAALEGREGDNAGPETRGGPEGVMPIGFEKEENQPYVGLRLSEISEIRGQDWIETVLDLLVSEGQRISTIYFSMDEFNLRRQVPLPWIKFASDAGGFDPAWAKALGPYHPRAYGTFPRVLGKYVREEGLLTLEEAIRKMSGAVAQRIGLKERGELREGYFADVVILDPETIADRATFADPHQLSVGVDDVWINGERVMENGHHTGALPGRFVKGMGG